MSAVLALSNGHVGGSLVDQAVRRVRDHIQSHDLKVGDTLPAEGFFASEFGVSRAVMREAFGALAALRLIDVGNGRKARVGAIDGSVIGTSLGHAVATAQVSLVEVWEVRRTLELRTVELAAARRSDEEAQAIVKAADAICASVDDMSKLAVHDIAFHQAIARASGNTLFLQIIRSFEQLMEVAVPSAWKTRTAREQRGQIMEHHLAIARAIYDRDPGEAASRMTLHFDTSIGDLLADS